MSDIGRRVYATYLEWLVRIDEQELTARSRDGSASAKWAAALLESIGRQWDRIDGLRSPRINYRRTQ